MEKLKPCVCGTIVHILRDEYFVLDTPAHHISIFCPTCHKCMDDCIKDETALIENWNNWVKNNKNKEK